MTLIFMEYLNTIITLYILNLYFKVATETFSIKNFLWKISHYDISLIFLIT